MTTKHALQNSVEQLSLESPETALTAVKAFLEQKSDLLLVRHHEMTDLIPGSHDLYKSFDRYTYIDPQEKMICLLESTPYLESIRIVHLDETEPTQYYFSRFSKPSEDGQERVYQHASYHAPLGGFDRNVMKQDYAPHFN